MTEKPPELIRLGEWVKTFRGMHERSKRGRLSAPARDVYLVRGEELARAAIAIQGLGALRDRRHDFRVARALRVTLTLGTRTVRATTLNISGGGFACQVATAPRATRPVRFGLALPGASRVTGECTLVRSIPMRIGFRASFAFDDLERYGAEALSSFLLEAVLDALDAHA